MNNRESFEAWLKSRSLDNTQTLDACDRWIYKETHIQAMYEGWQAGLASQAHQTENLITRKAFICPACEGVDADSPVSSCHCMENDSNTFIEGTITYRLPPAPEGVK